MKAFMRASLWAPLLGFLTLPQAGTAADCGDPARPIARVQGQGEHSPLTGEAVTVEGILTLDSRREGGFRGFYLQQADHETDGDPRTSEALFVYTRRQAGEPGDRLRVTGTVREYHGLTELVGIKHLTVCGQAPLPEPAALTLPWPQPPESLENMRVAFAQPLTVIDTHNLARYGELTLARDDQIAATERQSPGPAAWKMSQGYRQHRVLLDDGLGQRDPRPVPWPTGGLGPDNTLRAGDIANRISGVLDFRFGAWRIQPERPPEFRHTNARPAPPARPEGDHLRVLTMNLGNYFNGNGRGEGFPTPRGAHTRADYRDQHQRLLAALTAPDPDILALAEMENDGYGPGSAISALAAGLGPQWQVIATPGQDGNDQIRTALLYRADRVRPTGAPERLTSGPFRHRGRPPLAQAFTTTGSQSAVTIVAVHLKSKACRGAKGLDLDQQEGEGCYAHRRTRAADAILQWLASLPADARQAGTLITGDLNSYARESPLARFRNGGFTSMVHHFHSCVATDCSQYTYRYRGTKGSLDYALASSTLVPAILSAQTWKINADEPPVLGYQGLDAPGAPPWRSSDHNPVITDIRLAAP